MGHHQITRLFILFLVSLSLSACQKVMSRGELMAYKWTHKPGEELVASYQETSAKHKCTDTPVVHLEGTLFKPDKMVPGAQILNRFVYASCAPEAISGLIVRQVKYNGKVVLEDVTPHNFVPGTWGVNAYLQIPSAAPPGAYVFVLTITAGDQAFRETFPFEVI